MRKVNAIPKHIKSCVMASNATFPFSLMALLVWLIVSQGAVAQEVPDDLLELRPGGYAFADYPGVFDAIDGEGITLEAWIYLTDLPLDWTFRNPGPVRGGDSGSSWRSRLDRVRPP